jgi:hypothetical protein
MVIGIDITFLKDQYSRRGIGTYGKCLISKLLEDKTNNYVLFGFEDFNSNLKLLGIKKDTNISYVSFGKARPSNPLNPFFFNLFYLPKIVKANLDIYFAPHFERGLPVGKVKTAVMMHDVIPLVSGKYSSRGGLVNFIKGRFYKNNLKRAQKADIVFTNSDFSKRELINKGGFDEAKVHRVYLGIKDTFRQDNIDQDTREIRRILLLYKVSKPYILNYGGLESNKNVPAILHAYKNIIKRFPDLKLVIVGKDFKIGWDNKVKALTPQAKELLALSEDLKLKHSLIFTGEVDDVHLPLILNNAEALIHLSEYEGFGFAVLEGMAANIPVIASRRSCYPEILQDAAYFVDPKNTEKISEALLQVLEDDKLKKDLLKKGNKVANIYSWDKCASETLTLLKNTLDMLPKHTITYLVTNFHPIKGGAEQNALMLAIKESEAENTVKVYTSNSNNKELISKEIYKGIEISRFKKVNKSYYLSFYPSMFWPFLRNKTDLIHVHGFGFLWHDFLLIIKKIFNPRLKIINTPHGPFMAHGQYSLFQKVLKSIFTFIQRLYLNAIYSRVIAVNPYQIEWINKEYGISKDKIVLVPNAISDAYEDFKEDKELIEHLKLEKKFIISFIGRFEKYKGLQDLIKCVVELKSKFKNLQLIAMGNEGNYLSKINELITDSKAEKYITILTSPQDDSVKTVLSKSAIFVLPSSWEAFGISIIEAMRFGNAIVSTRTEGGEYLIKEEENGFLYDFQDTVDLTSRLETLISDKQLLKKIKTNNIKKALEFSISSVYDTYRVILRELLK